MNYIFDDGGRYEAGFYGRVGDCALRALCILTSFEYRDTFEYFAEVSGVETQDGISMGVAEQLYREADLTKVWEGRGLSLEEAHATYGDCIVITNSGDVLHALAIVDGAVRDNRDSRYSMRTKETFGMMVGYERETRAIAVWSYDAS